MKLMLCPEGIEEMGRCSVPNRRCGKPRECIKHRRNVHYTRLQHVVDRTGKLFNVDDTPHAFNGHFSWIPALNNQICEDLNGESVKVNGKEVTLFEWVALQQRDPIA